jgi:hypothetical protein
VSHVGRNGVAGAALIALIAGCGGQPSGGGTSADSTGNAADGVRSEAPAPGGSGGAQVGRRVERAAPREETLAAGTAFEGALQQTVSTDKSQVGDKIEVRTTEPVRAGEKLVVPSGATIRGEVTSVEGAGRVAGGAHLTLRFQELVLADGTSYPISCEPFRLKGKSAGKESALEIGGGAVAGGVLGGLLGGKKDIVKGAAVGAVLGTGVAVATKGKQIVLPVGQKLRVTLTAPVAVAVKPVTS